MTEDSLKRGWSLLPCGETVLGKEANDVEDVGSRLPLTLVASEWNTQAGGDVPPLFYQLNWCISLMMPTCVCQTQSQVIVLGSTSSTFRTFSLVSPPEPFKQIKALTKAREAWGKQKHKIMPPSGFPHKKTNKHRRAAPQRDVSIQNQSAKEGLIVFF